MKYILDLDGVLSSNEIMLSLANHFNLKEDFYDVYRNELSGEISYIEAFIFYVNMLSNHPVSEIAGCLSKIPLNSNVTSFVENNLTHVIIVTNLLSVWCKIIFERFGCECYGSLAKCEEDKVVKIEKILRKEDIVEMTKATNEKVVFVGGKNSCIEAMRCADVSITSGLVFSPSQSLFSITDYVIYSDKAMLRQLNQLAGIIFDRKSVVITCAGIGSRLGLGKTKALVNINHKSLISYQLKLFEKIEDIRIVVGFQANDVIKEVMKYRKDVVFCFNHRFFETKTGASFYLGARHANNEVIEWDGDLLVHPGDVQTILETAGEFICYSDISSDEAVFLQVDEKGFVTSFSRKNGDYEWTGPACIYRDNVKYNSKNVFNILEPLLPIRGIKVSAYDVDTYDDFLRVSVITKNWMS